jgi:hypothetical protein
MFFSHLRSERAVDGKLNLAAVPNNILRHLEQLKVDTIVVEPEYRDRDFLNDFSAFYARCHHSYPRHCRRLHFFRAFSDRLPDSASLLPYIVGDASDEQSAAMQDAYCGFMVCRPLPSAQVGRTVLKPLKSKEYGEGKRDYPCIRRYRVNLFGIDLSLRGLAFQEQDTVLASCATVALWSFFQRTSKLFGTAEISPAEITQAANQVVHTRRPIPSSGLSVQQMCAAIRRMGLEPEVITLTPDVPVLSLIYGYLSLGLPVVLGGRFPYSRPDEDHAITINGFCLEPDRVNDSEARPCVPSLQMPGLRISEFYAHDDQIAPYTGMRPAVAACPAMAPSRTFTPSHLTANGQKRTVLRGHSRQSASLLGSTTRSG